MFVKVASVPVIRLRLAIIRLTLAPNRDDALVIVVLDICICMCICCQVSKMTERIWAHNVHPVPTGRLPLDLGYITAHPVGGSPRNLVGMQHLPTSYIRPFVYISNWGTFVNWERGGLICFSSNAPHFISISMLWRSRQDAADSHREHSCQKKKPKNTRTPASIYTICQIILFSISREVISKIELNSAPMRTLGVTKRQKQIQNIFHGTCNIDCTLITVGPLRVWVTCWQRCVYAAYITAFAPPFEIAAEFQNSESSTFGGFQRRAHTHTHTTSVFPRFFLTTNRRRSKSKRTARV